MLKKILASLLLTFAVSSSASATFSISYEDPGVQNSTATFAFQGVQIFDNKPIGIDNFVTHFGGGVNGTITGTYSNVNVVAANQYGGAGGIGNYAASFSNTPYTLDLTTRDSRGINYFGYWLSALDAGNTINFYNGSQLVYTFTPNDVLLAIGSNPDYFGNPNAKYLHQDGGEPFAFINVFDKGGTFTRVSFSQNGGGGYESDNHTVGFFTKGSGNVVPEPAGIAILGLGLIGVASRRRR